MKIIGTGLSGLVGSRIVELSPQHQFTDLSLDTGCDILKPETLEDIFKTNSAEVVLHLAAFTNTNADPSQAELCRQINVVGTQNIVNLCQKYGKHLIHISTDFVFDGSKAGQYVETDATCPIEGDTYGQTKCEAEKIAQTVPSTIVRIAYPYRSKFDPKVDLIRKIIGKLQQGQTCTLFTDQITTPTFVDDIAIGLNKIIDKKPVGIYHLVGSSSQSVYDMGKLIASIFGIDQNLIQPSSIKDITTRQYPANLALSNQKFVAKFGFTPKTLTEGLAELKKQLDSTL